MTAVSAQPIPCLILACGNPLREDDGIGPRLAEWAAEHWRSDPRIRVISRQQWTPELAADIAAAQSVLFLDSSVECGPGTLKVHPVRPAATPHGLNTHHSGASEILSLARDLYLTLPRTALLFTVGAASLGLHEGLSNTVQAALPRAIDLLQTTVQDLLSALPTPGHLHSA